MRIIKTYFILSLLLFTNLLSAQNDINPKADTIEISKPSILSTHPLGLLFTRLEGHFKTQPSKKTIIDFNISSGNVWAPPVKAYIPNLESDRGFISQFPWHSREFTVDVDTLNAKTLEIQNDGVIKAFNFKLDIPINNKSALVISLKSFLLTSGKSPFTIFTSDKFIESFHDKIAGGEDPFDRKLYPYDKARLRYKDRNDNVMDINGGDFIFSGIETSYYYYPEIKNLNKRNYFLNYGSHLGINTSKYNKSVDVGISTNLIKSFEIKERKKIQLGFSFGAVYRKLIKFDSNTIDLGTNNNIGYLETIMEYKYLSKSGTTHAFGADFYVQTSLNKKNEFDYVIPIKNGTALKSWNSGISNLYRNNNYWTLMYAFGKKNIVKFYLQQDFTVNNHPDIQTGIGYSISI